MAYTDNFNRADSLNLGADWTANSDGSIGITTNQAKGRGASGARNANLYTAHTFLGDHYSEVEYVSTPPSGDWISPCVRMQSSANTYAYYALLYNNAGTLQAAIWRVEGNNGWTNLSGYTNVTAAAGDKFRLEAKGDVITLYQNGTSIRTYTDSSAYKLTGGSPGAAVTGAALFDNYAASDLGIVGAGNIASGEAFGSAALSVTIDGGSVASGEALGQPGISASIADAGNISSGEAIGQPTITLGTPQDIVGAGGIGSAEAIGQPEITLGAIVQPKEIPQEGGGGRRGKKKFRHWPPPQEDEQIPPPEDDELEQRIEDQAAAVMQAEQIVRDHEQKIAEIVLDLDLGPALTDSGEHATIVGEKFKEAIAKRQEIKKQLEKDVEVARAAVEEAKKRLEDTLDALDEEESVILSLIMEVL